MVTIALIALCSFLSLGAANAYEVDTHFALSSKAVDISRLTGFVNEQLGYQYGADTVIANSSLTEWVGLGSKYEDGGLRFFNHFHNPLRSWSGAGLTLVFGTSAAIWAQSQGGHSPEASWWAARRQLYRALTQADPSARDAELANALTLLGHQIHLVQDMAQTAHTRDDAHPKIFLDPEPLEVHTDRVLKKDPSKFARWLDNALKPDVSLLQRQSPSDAAPAPIANLIDSSEGNERPTAAMTGTGIGLAEFTNTNFFSIDTILDTTNFPFPRWDSLGPRYSHFPIWPSSPVTHYYRSKIADGEPVAHFVTEGALGPFLEHNPDLHRLTFSIDASVVEDYATILLPRAVGYSAAMIDYFVRGDLELVPTGRRRQPFEVENKSTEPMEGFIEVYYDDENGNRSSVGRTQTDGALAPGARVPVDITWPTNVAAKMPGEFLLVFKGKHGLEGLAASDEQYAVVAGRSQVPPPPLAPGANAGPGHSIPGSTPHTHAGASASDANGDLASYTWSWSSCPAACPALSNTGGSLGGGTSSVPVPGPTFTLTEGGTHTLQLEVRDGAGNRTRSSTYHQIGTDIQVIAYRMSDGSADSYDRPSAWAWPSQYAYPGEIYEWDDMFLWMDADHDLFLPAEAFVVCGSEAPCAELIATNFESPLGDLGEGMVFPAGESFQLRYLVRFTKPGDHALGVRFNAIGYWYFEWYAYVRVL